MKKILLLIIVLTVHFSLQAGQDYYAGYKRIFVNSDHFDRFPVAVWFPTKQPSEIEKFGPFILKISLGATLATGKFPLVVVSHGSGGSLLGHRDTAQYLAQQGYIVAAVLHPRNNYENNKDEATTQNWINRPKHISVALDNILQHKKFSEHIDTKKIAIMGHSAGGYTALTLLGGIPNTKHSRLHCQNSYELDKGYCDLGKDKENRHQDLEIEGLADNRFRAGVLLAPVGILFSNAKSLAKVRAPILLYRAEFDKQLNYPFHSELIVQRFPEKKKLTYQILEGANHFSFIAPFPNSIAENVGMPAKDLPEFDRQKAHNKINQNILDFLNRVL